MITFSLSKGKERDNMSMKCTKCGYSGPNLIVEISGNKTYITCRNCNYSTTFDNFKKESDIKELPPMKLVNTSESVSADSFSFSLVQEVDSEPDTTSLDGSIAEEVDSAVCDNVHTVEDCEQLTESPFLHTPKEVCPKCSSESIAIEMSTAKLGYITCRDCGYDSKAEGKRHRIDE